MPLVALLAEWEDHLKALERGPDCIAEKVSRARTAFVACRFTFPGDLSAEPVQRYLSTLTKARRTNAGDPPLAKAAPRTRNHTLQAVRQFARWLLSGGRLPRDPFAQLKPVNPNAGITRRRAEFSPGDLTELYAVTAERKTLRDLTGPDRVMLYRVAVNTGYRASELAALTVESFDLTAEPPVAILSGGHTKNGQPARQPLPRDLARDLGPFLAGRSGIVWPGTWVDRSAAMPAKDMKKAAIAVTVSGPEGDETRDFHAFRATDLTNVVRSGADLKQAMTLARHSDPKLTAGTYARARMDDLGALANRLATATVDPTRRSSQRGEWDTNGERRGKAYRRGRIHRPVGSATGARESDGRGRPRRVEDSAPGRIRTSDHPFRKLPERNPVRPLEALNS